MTKAIMMDILQELGGLKLKQTKSSMKETSLKITSDNLMVEAWNLETQSLDSSIPSMPTRFPSQKSILKQSPIHHITTNTSTSTLRFMGVMIITWIQFFVQKVGFQTEVTASRPLNKIPL